MTLVGLVDLVAVSGSMTALVFLFLGARRTPGRPEVMLFALILLLTVSHDAGNFLEWAEFTNWFDRLEDFLEVLTAALWAFFFYTFLQEMTERRLREVQELDEKILDGSPVAFVLRDSDLRILKVSRAFEKVTGYDPAMVIGKKTEEFMPDMPGREELAARLRKVLETGEQQGPTEVKAPSPVPRCIRENIFPVRDRKGKVTNTLSVLEDISTQVETERRLREIQELDERILDGSPVAFVLHDPEMRILRVSSAYEKVTGFKAPDVIGRTLTEFMSPGPERDQIILSIEKVMEGGLQIGPQDIESPIPGRYLRETILPVLDPDGRLVNTLAVLEDITEQRLASEALQESEARYRMLFDNIHDGVVLHLFEEDGRPGPFIEVNARFCQMTGYSRRELLTMTPLDLAGADQMENVESVRVNLSKGRSAFFERSIITKGGQSVPCELNAHSLLLGDKQVILSVVRDITDRREAQDRIRDSLVEKETLLREIHHRVKNNLQVISGLLNLQSHYIDDEGVRSIYKESQNRIKTMALIHEELYQREDLARINLADYIGGLARNLMASYSIVNGRIGLEMDLADVEISIDTAIPCGLIVNEIVSNSLAHAFPEEKRGHIRIEFCLLQSGEYELTISDDGQGLPDDLDLTETGTLGLRLVSILAEQLGAQLQMTGDGGTTFKLVFREYLEAGTEMY